MSRFFVRFFILFNWKGCDKFRLHIRKELILKTIFSIEPSAPKLYPTVKCTCNGWGANCDYCKIMDKLIESGGGPTGGWVEDHKESSGGWGHNDSTSGWGRDDSAGWGKW